MKFHKTVINFFALFCNYRVAKYILRMANEGYLRQIGWIKSLKTRKSVDNNNNPIPWVTYPFFYFIKERLKDDFEIFEYGTGFSTLYYAKIVKKIYTVEDDVGWYKEMKTQASDNVILYLNQINEENKYEQSIHISNKYFDLVIIDGRKRVKCILEGLKRLNQRGVIILDDSERERYREGIETILKAGFKRLDFWGIAPGVTDLKSTTVFYKEDNCLNI